MAINLKIDSLIYPYFVIEGRNKKEQIKSFPGVFRFSTDRLLKDIAETRHLGLNKILLFGRPRKKDKEAFSAYRSDNIVARTIKNIKNEFKGLTVISDVCLCAYTTHGHCGILKENSREIDSRRTLRRLADIALSHADAGVDIVAPSAMAKKQVSAIREELDKKGYRQLKIMGYSAKFASNFYGPFREAFNSSPKFGDRSGYQLKFNDSCAALKEIAQDIKEGADIVMVKPALTYLDIIREASRRFRLPLAAPRHIGLASAPLLAAYNTSGEYSMVKYGAKNGLWDEKKTVFEIITAIKRAGADLIITYHAKDIAKWLKQA